MMLPQGTYTGIFAARRFVVWLDSRVIKVTGADSQGKATDGYTLHGLEIRLKVHASTLFVVVSQEGDCELGQGRCPRCLTMQTEGTRSLEFSEV